MWAFFGTQCIHILWLKNFQTRTLKPSLWNPKNYFQTPLITPTSKPVTSKPSLVNLIGPLPNPLPRFVPLKHQIRLTPLSKGTLSRQVRSLVLYPPQFIQFTHWNLPRVNDTRWRCTVYRDLRLRHVDKSMTASSFTQHALLDVCIRSTACISYRIRQNARTCDWKQSHCTIISIWAWAKRNHVG